MWSALYLFDVIFFQPVQKRKQNDAADYSGHLGTDAFKCGDGQRPQSREEE